VKRREFITMIGGAAATWPFATRAQQPAKLPIIGYLGANTPSTQSQWTAAFVQRLHELGWIEGRTVAIEALLPFGGQLGGYKGSGLALMMQALGVLAGAGSQAKSDYGYLFIAFKPDLVGPPEVFETQATQLIDRLKATPRQPGVDEIRIPSERAFRSQERLVREGLEIDRLVFDALGALKARSH
jgi:hypothetical protein